MVRHDRTTFVSVSWEKKANFFTKAKGYLVNHKLLTRLAFNKKKKRFRQCSLSCLYIQQLHMTVSYCLKNK